MLLGCVCVLILSLHACHLERGSHNLPPAGLYSPSKGKYYAVHAKNYSDFERILKFKHLLGADVKCCNFLVEKSDTKCLFLKVRYQGAVSL